jgi:hypothetical protein
MVRSTEFVKKLLRSRILLEKGRDYELGPEFVNAYIEARHGSGKKRREAVLTVLSQLDPELTAEDLSEGCIFIESFLGEED